MNRKRQLKKSEIDDILGFIRINTEIPRDIAEFHVNKEKMRLRAQLEKIRVYPAVIPILKKRIMDAFYSTLVSPGESVGIYLAQSVGEKQTQGALNTFHKTGSSEKQPVTSSFLELLNVTKSPKNPEVFLYLSEGNGTVQEVRKIVGGSLVDITFEKLIIEYQVSFEKQEKRWYSLRSWSFDDSDSDSERETEDIFSFPCLSLKIDMELLYKYSITLRHLCIVIQKSFSEIYPIYSPDCYGTIDIFIDVKNVQIPEELSLGSIDDEKIRKVHDLYINGVVIKKLAPITIQGIDGVENMSILQEKYCKWTKVEKNSEKSRWMIELQLKREKLKNAVTCFKRILQLPYIDQRKIVINNVWVIFMSLGIEACRTYMIEEFTHLMPGINKCHIILLVDKITRDGSPSSISRYSMRDSTSGPLGPCTFEEINDNFTDAGTKGKSDDTNGISASLIFGKKGKVGTGKPIITIDTEMLDEI